METPKIKTLAKIREEAHFNGLSKSKTAKEMGELTVVGLGYVSSIVIDHIIEDRATLHTSLVAAVEGRKLAKDDYEKSGFYTYSDFTEHRHTHNQALDDTLTIINSIFKK